MSQVRRVSPEEAHELMQGGYTYLDVRSEPEFEAGHPVGAHNVPLLHASAGKMVPNPDFLAVVQALFPRDTPLVVGCKSGGRSLRAAEILAAAGFTDVVDQRAGYDGARDPFGKLLEPGWAPAGLPTTRESQGLSYAELRRRAGA